jgi:protein tyrosine phosphatase (PTP) superfamily phosphohydrolase (DUF442 family)
MYSAAANGGTVGFQLASDRQRCERAWNGSEDYGMGRDVKCSVQKTKHTADLFRSSHGSHLALQQHLNMQDREHSVTRLSINRQPDYRSVTRILEKPVTWLSINRQPDYRTTGNPTLDQPATRLSNSRSHGSHQPVTRLSSTGYQTLDQPATRLSNSRHMALDQPATRLSINRQPDSRTAGHMALINRSPDSRSTGNPTLEQPVTWLSINRSPDFRSTGNPTLHQPATRLSINRSPDSRQPGPNTRSSDLFFF